MEDDFFNFDSSLDDWDEPAEEPFKYHITNVWHEMGHLIGHQMAKRLGYDFGKITALHFGESPKICTTSIYSPKGNVLECIDEYGLKNMCLDDQQDIDRIAAAVKDKKATLAYIIYLLGGGLFNIYAVKETPDESDFNDCYLDSIEEEGADFITARAGNDWSKVRRLAQIDHWDLKALVDLRSALFFLLRDNGVFALLKPTLDQTDLNHNGEIISGTVLTSVELEMEKSLNIIDAAFWEKLDKLLNDYQSKL